MRLGKGDLELLELDNLMLPGWSEILLDMFDEYVDLLHCRRRIQRSLQGLQRIQIHPQRNRLMVGLSLHLQRIKINFHTQLWRAKNYRWCRVLLTHPYKFPKHDWRLMEHCSWKYYRRACQQCKLWNFGRSSLLILRLLLALKWQCLRLGILPRKCTDDRKQMHSGLNNLKVLILLEELT